MRYRWLIVMAAAWLAAGVQTAGAQGQADEPAREAASQPSAPSAEDLERAKRLFQSAEALKALGDEQAEQGETDQARESYGRAARDYLEAYRLSELPLFLYNLGSIYRLRGDTRWSIRCYRAFLATEPESEKDVQDTRTFIEELEGKLGEAGSRAGSEPEPGIDIDPSEVCELEDEPAPAAPIEKEPEPVGPDEPVVEPGGDPVLPVQDPGSEPGAGYRKAFWGAAGVSAVAAMATVVTALQVKGLEEDKREAIASSGVALDPNDACTDAREKNVQEVADICDKGESRATLSNVFLGATVVGAMIAGYSYYKGYAGGGDTRTEQAPTAAVRPVLGPTAVGAELLWRF